MMRINRQQFASLRCDQVALLNNLQEELGVKIVAYSISRHSRFENQTETVSLCQVVTADCLGGEQLRALHRLEARLGSDIALVAYAWPWRRNDHIKRRA
jgi:hypothetical protein